MKIFSKYLLLLILSYTTFPSLVHASSSAVSRIAGDSRSVYGKVVKVIDGDSVLVSIDRRQVQIRLIGVDTPEKNPSDKLERDSQMFGQSKKVLKHLGKESGDITKRLVNGKTVRLEFDQERTDKYGRTLAYVFFLMSEKDLVKKMDLEADFPLEKTERQFFLNRTLVEYGYALAYRKFHYRYKDEFIELERTAQKEGLGLWTPDKKRRALRKFPDAEIQPQPRDLSIPPAR